MIQEFQDGKERMMPELKVHPQESPPADVSSPPRVKTGKLDHIDALRGIAALSILFYHMSGRVTALFGLYPFQMLPDRFIGLNMASVPLFFVISAFTLYLSLDNKSEEKDRFIKFYIRRFFRIAPLFYFLLILVVLDCIIHDKALSWTELLSNFAFAFNLVPEYSKSLTIDGWTIGVEMLFYLFLPLIFLKVNNIKRAIIFTIAVFYLALAGKQLEVMILGEQIVNEYWHYNLFKWLFIFPAGILCYMFYKNYLPKIKKEHEVPTAIGMLFLAIIVLFYFVDNFDLNLAIYDRFEPLTVLTSMQIMSPIAFCLLILSLSLATNGLIVNRITRFYGMISYSFYLVHPYLMALLESVYEYIYAHTVISTDVSFCLCVLLTIIAATAVSWFTYHFVESPGMRYGKKIIARM